VRLGDVVLADVPRTFAQSQGGGSGSVQLRTLLSSVGVVAGGARSDATLVVTIV